jgi:cytochrome c-type biogenesis protein CcmH
MSARAILAGLTLLVSSAALAVEPSEQLTDPALEARARVISQELRCQVCQNQSIDDSNAPLAADLRRLVRERLQAGDSDRAVFAFLTQRYGDNVLLRPPLRLDTALLWFGPLTLLLVAGTALLLKMRRRRAATADAPLSAPLSADEEARLAALAPPEK